MLTQHRRFGIELELFGITSTALCEGLSKEGIQCHSESWNKTVRPHWKIVPDGSISNNGFELVSPILQGEQGLKDIKTVSGVLIKLGAKVDSSCGFHVHIDASDLHIKDFENILKRYAKHEKLIDSWIAPSRRVNNNRTYAASVIQLAKDFQITSQNIQEIDTNEYSIKEIIEEYVDDRDFKLNVLAFCTHGTIEFRHHQGTINYNKIIPWVLFCLNFIENSKMKRINESLLSKEDRRNIHNLLGVFDHLKIKNIPITFTSIKHTLQVSRKKTVEYIKQISTTTKALMQTDGGFLSKIDNISKEWKNRNKECEFSFDKKSDKDPLKGLSDETIKYFHTRISYFEEREKLKKTKAKKKQVS